MANRGVWSDEGDDAPPRHSGAAVALAFHLLAIDCPPSAAFLGAGNDIIVGLATGIDVVGSAGRVCGAAVGGDCLWVGKGA